MIVSNSNSSKFALPYIRRVHILRLIDHSLGGVTTSDIRFAVNAKLQDEYLN